MAFHFDSYDGSLVIDGFAAGVADDPYSGIADLRNVNITSVPGEASVGFATTKASSPSSSGTVTAVNANILTFTGGAGLENGVSISFSNVASYSGINTSTPYWIGNFGSGGAGTFELYSDVGTGSLVTITGSGNATFSTFNMAQPKYFANSNPTSGALRKYWLLDSAGQVWTNEFVTTSNYWRYTGNLPSSTSNGNGIAYYESSNGNGYLFVFSNSYIDYVPDNGGYIWQYQWNPANGNTGQGNHYLNAGASENVSHETLVGQDNVVYYCDTNYLGSFFETPGQFFDPTTLATYTPAKQALALPIVDNANCLAELGVNLLVGGQRNLIYPWNRTATSFTYPIFLSENVVSKMITVNTNTYIFCGNRGRIYITNGSQAQMYKKIPDHISGTVEPYYQWGGVTSTKNKLFFSAYVTTNAGVAITTYGGAWSINLDNAAIFLANQLSYGSYAGFASAMIAQTPAVNNITNQAGTGLYIGWNQNPSVQDRGASGGLDATVSTPYTGSQATIDSDLIPIGTYQKPRNFTSIEYKLTKPMVQGESINIYFRKDFSQAYTLAFTDSTAGNFSMRGPQNFPNAQWIQFQIVLNSTATNPSYTRLKEIRILGLVGPTLANSQQIGL